MEYCLVEHWAKGCKLPENCTAVALTPQAIYYLEQERIPYIVLEDYYNSCDLRGDVEAHVREQVAWFERFDQYVQKIYPKAQELNIGVPSMLHHRLKYQVDDVILSTKLLRQFMEAEKPTKIWFVRLLTGKRTMAANFYPTHDSVFSRIMPLVCWDYGVPFERLNYFDKESNRASLRQYFRQGVQDKARLKQILKDKIPEPILRYLFSIKNNVYWKKQQADAGEYDLKKGKILFLRTGSFISYFCKDLKRHGFDVYLKIGETIKRYGDPDYIFQGNNAPLKVNRNLGKHKITDVQFEEFLHGELMQWIDRKCGGVNASSILRRNFELVLKEFAPEIIKQTEQFVSFLDEEKFDYIATHFYTLTGDIGHASNKFSFDVVSAVAASRLSKKTKSIGISHGWDAWDSQPRFFLLPGYFDIYIYPTKGEADHGEYIKKLFNSKKPVGYHMDYMRRYFVDRLRKPNSPDHAERTFSAGSKPVVLFVPIVVRPWGHKPIFRGQMFPMEYIRWHRALAEYMAQRTDYHFIWKGFYCRGHNFELMKQVIHDKQYANIEYSSGPIPEWLSKADRVISESPSTPLYEAACAQKPVLSLYFPGQRMRQNVFAEYGNSLAQHSNIEEGIALVDRFLSEDRENYIVSSIDPPVSLPQELLKHIGNNEDFDQKLEEDLLINK